MSDRKIIIITGASSGIGKATMSLFRDGGHQVIGIARRFENTKSTRRCDINNSQQVEEVFKNILHEFGRVDALVNCAGITTTTESLNISNEEWNAILQTNLVGTYFCCRSLIPSMREQKYGKIVNISSIAGRSYSQSSSLAYTASKYAVIGLTRQLAAQFAQYGININCVCPAQTETEMLMTFVPKEKQEALAAKNPMKRLAKPSEIAEVIAFLASDQSSYMNGAIIDVNGGLLSV